MMVKDQTRTDFAEIWRVGFFWHVPSESKSNKATQNFWILKHPSAKARVYLINQLYIV